MVSPRWVSAGNLPFRRVEAATLGWRPAYPTYREVLAAILAAEA